MNLTLHGIEAPESDSSMGGAMRTFRTLVTVVFAAGAVLVLETADGWAAKGGTDKVCSVYKAASQSILDAAGKKDSDKVRAAAFKKLAKVAPKAVKRAANTASKSFASGRSGSSLEHNRAVTKATAYFIERCGPAVEPGSQSGSASSGGSGGGTLTIGDNTYTFTSARCYLREQKTGGETIELSAQGQGTTADSERVFLDFTRYANDGDFFGDDIEIEIGPVGTDNIWSGNDIPHGTVRRNGSTLSLSDFELLHEGETVTASFELDCG